MTQEGTNINQDLRHQVGAQSTYRGEIGGVYLPPQLERKPPFLLGMVDSRGGHRHLQIGQMLDIDLISEHPHAPSPQMYVSKVWESVWPEGQEAIHSVSGCHIFVPAPHAPPPKGIGQRYKVVILPTTGIDRLKGGGRSPLPPPGWADFTIMMECTPESGFCHSVFSVGRGRVFTVQCPRGGSVNL